MNKNWTPRQTDNAPAELTDWAEKLDVSPLIARLLWNRGIETPQDMDAYLSPMLRRLEAPGTVPGMEQAAQVLADGIANGKKLCVWGDYDVDGVTSTALVKQFMEQRGYRAEHHLPNRKTEGYGLNTDSIEQLAMDGVELLLTVDCGITSHQEITRAKKLGITVVVSDHHLPDEHGSPQDAAAVTNPRLGDCPCPDLAGVGVTFLLMAAVNRLLPGDPIDVRQFLDLVALGSIADVVRLQGQNRILVKNGLLLIGEGRRPGIAALKEASKYAPTAAIGAGQVGFGLAPRINAAGRIGDAEKALQLLLAPTYEDARPLAGVLDTLNSERRAEEERILEQALSQADAHLHRLGLVLFAEDWHPGIIGIVASRVVEKHYRPTLILTSEGDVFKGSGRSTREFDLHAGLTACSDILAGFGGHKQAAGLSISPGDLDDLRDRFHRAVADQCGPKPLDPTLMVDGELPFADIDFDLLKELEMLQPFGPGNAEPVFTSPPVRITQRRIFGKNHVKLTLQDGASGIALSAKAWRQAQAFPPSMQGQRIRIAFTPKIDRYQGTASIDLQIKDWKLE